MVVIETFKILSGIGPIYMKGFVTEMQTSCHFRCYRMNQELQQKGMVQIVLRILLRPLGNSLPDPLQT